MNVKNLEEDAETANSDPKTAIKYLLNCLYVYQKCEKKKPKKH